MRSAVVPYVCAFLVTVGASTAGAAVYYSSLGYYTTNGKNYQNQAALFTNPSQGRTYVTSNSGTLPSGWMGVEGRLIYDSSGAVCRTTGMIYQGSPAVGISAGASPACGSNNYYSYGKTAAWNGNGYTYYYTYRTITQHGQ